MNKHKTLEKINLVKSKRPDTHIQHVLNDIEEYVINQSVYDYNDIMQFIQSKMSGKLGGNSIYINKSLEFLKNEIRSEYKKHKNIMKERKKKLKRILK